MATGNFRASQNIVMFRALSGSDTSWHAILQPDEGIQYSFESTYQEDTKRVQAGSLEAFPMFTVEQYSYKATDVSPADSSEILKIILNGHNFEAFLYSPYFGHWVVVKTYVGKGSLQIGTIQASSERMTELSFNFTGVHPVVSNTSSATTASSDEYVLVINATYSGTTTSPIVTAVNSMTPTKKSTTTDGYPVLKLSNYF